MPYKLGSQRLALDVAWTHTDGRQFPANFLRLSTQAERDALGLLWEEPTITNYDQRFYWGPDNPKQLNDGTDEKGNPITGLKTVWKQKQNEIANAMLAPSDWRVTKATELGTTVASKWLTYRGAVRSACNTRQSEITAVTTVEALRELFFGNPQVQQTDSDGNGVVDSDGNPVMIANPGLATAWPELPS